MNITNGGSFYWNGGNMDGTGTLHISANATLVIAGANLTLTMNQWTLVNDGTVNYSSGTLAIAGTYTSAAIVNAGIFNINGDLSITYDYLQPSIDFNNTGTVKKTSGNGNARLNLKLTGNGTVQALMGTITWD